MKARIESARMRYEKQAKDRLAAARLAHGISRNDAYRVSERLT